MYLSITVLCKLHLDRNTVQLKKSITKEEINQLPIYEYKGEIVLIDNKEDAIATISELRKYDVLGFDTETRAAFRKGESYDVSLLQLATPSTAYLYRVNKFKLIPELTAILSDPNIIKAGVAVRDDIKDLKKLRKFEDAGFVDLAEVARDKEIKNFGLRALTAICLGKRLSKKAQTSNWQQPNLTPAQVEYAASDAAVGLAIHNIFNQN